MTQKTNKGLSLGLAAVLCGLLLPSVIGASGNAVQRPWEMQAYSEMVVSLPDMTFLSSTAWIDASHCGQSLGEGWPGGGKIIAANGDVIFFAMTSLTHNVITGGTGRFEGASGEFDFAEEEVIGMGPGPKPGTATFYVVWTATGTITY
jgi:hypothetical protein